MSAAGRRGPRRSTFAHEGRVALLCVAAWTSHVLAGEHRDATTIDYRVHRSPCGDRYEITLRFRGDHSGRSTLTIPTSWAAATGAERGIEGLAVVTAGARLAATNAPQVWRIVHRPDAMLTVRYVLKPVAGDEPNASDRTALFLPVIRPSYFEWVGWTTWVIPLADNERRVHVRVAFDGLPPDWAFASSFGLDARDVRFDGPMSRFQAALFIGGDFRLRSRATRGGPVVTAMRGDWSLGDGAFADRVSAIVDGERSFWNDDSQPRFLIVLMPLAAPPNQRSTGGTGLTRAFLAQATTDQPLDALNHLLTHEYFHTWNASALGQLPEPQGRLYWFSEGFTDDYTNLLQLRLGLQSLAAFAGAYDAALRFLAESPAGHAANREVAERFFTDGATFGRVPYHRGLLLAAKWDAEIRAASSNARSLDDAMRHLRDERAQGAVVLDRARIERAVIALGVRDASGDVERWIERGDTPRLADERPGSCLAIADATEPLADIGFDLAGSTRGAALPIVGVDPDGPAYAAGLRDGDFLRGFRSLDRAEHVVEASYAQRVAGPIVTTRYRALGRPITRQHVTLRAGLSDAEAAGCLAALGAPPIAVRP